MGPAAGGMLVEILVALVPMMATTSNTSGVLGHFDNIRVTRNYLVEGEVFEQTTAAYENRPLTRNDLQEMADRLTKDCRGDGYFLCRADIPDQNLESPELVVAMSYGYISEVVAPPEMQRVVNEIFAPVLSQRPVRGQSLNQAIAQLDALPGVSLTGVKPVRIQGDEYFLDVRGAFKKTRLRGLATNHGWRRDNPIKAYIALEQNDRLLPGDQLIVGYLTRAERPSELSSWNVKYTVPHLRRRFTVSTLASYANSSPRSQFSNRDLDGSVARAAVQLHLATAQKKTRAHGLKVSFASLVSEENENDAQIFKDEIHTVSLSAYLRQNIGKRMRGNIAVDVKKGLDILGAQGQSRADGTIDFLTVTGKAGVEARLIGRVLTRLSVSGQLSEGPLLFSQEFAFGGGSYGRGYDFGEVMGDQGAAAFAELAWASKPIGLFSRIEPYVYADVGTVFNNGVDFVADGKDLWSAGGGVRAQTKMGFSFSYEAAMPLSDAPYTIEDDELRHRFEIQYLSPSR